ncbi:hypothetical protein M422DRAFT_73896 [Sphaerobolus stellatus SS14]|nr:hypothetical protein M422DRAFT_73896 [Sphaerobolus stellatus SS14]
MRLPPLILNHLRPTATILRRTMSTAIPSTMRAIAISKHGDPSVLEEMTLPTPIPKPNEVLVKVEWVGVNFIDTYQRAGVYPHPGPWPMVIGNEAAGKIVKLPTDSKVLEDPWYKRFDYKEGANTLIRNKGVLAEYVAVPFKAVQPLPSTIPTRLAASSFTQGLTAITFLNEAYHPKPGEWILIHTAAGGLGLIMTQYASRLGAKVIGTTSSEEKAKLAKENGATEMIIYTKEDTVARVLEITGGEGVSAVFDGVGKDTWENDFKLIRRKGTIVSVGNASGVVPPFAPLKLTEKNLKVCRPTLFNYLETSDEIAHYFGELWGLLEKDEIKIKIHKEYPFTAEGVKEAHQDITGRSTVGKLLIKVARDE